MTYKVTELPHACGPFPDPDPYDDGTVIECQGNRFISGVWRKCGREYERFTNIWTKRPGWRVRDYGW